MNGGLGPAACWLTHKRLESWSRMAKERVGVVRKASTSTDRSEDGETISTTSATSSPKHQPLLGSASNSISSSTEECQVLHDTHAIQPASTVAAHSVNVDQLRGPLEIAPSQLHSYLQHQSKSFPPRMQRTPSVSSQSSLESAPTRGHRGSSPQIRAFGPDGRSTVTAPEHGHSSSSSISGPRSPSPMRAISLDARSAPPQATPSGSSDLHYHYHHHPLQHQHHHHHHHGQHSTHDLRSAGPSLNSLNSIAAGGSGGGSGSLSSLSPKVAGRCLSPLLIPPRSGAAGTNLGGGAVGGLGLGEAGGSMGPASPLGALQLDLYQRPEGPVYLTAPDDSTTLGKLHLRLQYDSNVSDLTVHLIEAQSLSSIEEGGFRDPYVRLSLDPEVDGRKRETGIHRGEVHPYFNEHFKFPVSRDQLQGKELVLQVFDYDRYSHNDIIGEVRIGLDELQLSKSIEIWGDLLRAKKPPEDRPELLVSLSYLPHAERMTITIMKARNLNVDHEPSVRFYQIVNGKRNKKKRTKTSFHSDPSNPIWNESYSFNFPPDFIQSSGFEIYVMTTGGESNALSCGIGPQELGTGKEHWLDVTHPSSHKQSAMWHSLR